MVLDTLSLPELIQRETLREEDSRLDDKLNEKDFLGMDESTGSTSNSSFYDSFAVVSGCSLLESAAARGSISTTSNANPHQRCSYNHNNNVVGIMQDESLKDCWFGPQRGTESTTIMEDDDMVALQLSANLPVGLVMVGELRKTPGQEFTTTIMDATGSHDNPLNKFLGFLWNKNTNTRDQADV